MKKIIGIFRLLLVVLISGSMLTCAAGKYKKGFRSNLPNLRIDPRNQKLSECNLSSIPLDQTYVKSLKEFLKRTNEKDKIKKQISKIIPKNFKLDERIAALDIGAGDGILTQFLGGFFNEVYAIEPNKTLCEKITSRCKNNDHVTYFLLQSRFEDFSKNALFSQYIGKFDLILISHAFKFITPESISNQEKELLNIKKLLKPGGLLLIIENNQGNQFVQFYEGNGPKIWELGRESSPKPPDYTILLPKAFRVKKTTFNSKFNPPSLEALLGMSPFVFDTDLREMKKEKLIETYKELLKQYGHDPITFKTTLDMYICSPK